MKVVKALLSYPMLFLCLVLTYSQFAHAERLALEGSALSFERPNELFVAAANAPNLFFYSPCDKCTDSPALISLVKLVGPLTTIEKYVADASKGLKKLIAPREKTIAGLRSMEFATEGPGPGTHWTPPGGREVSHLYVFKYGDQMYICHLLSNAEAYRSVLSDFQSFCNSIRVESSR